MAIDGENFKVRAIAGDTHLGKTVSLYEVLSGVVTLVSYSE